MSRVGKVPVKVSPGAKVEVKDGWIKVEGPKGKLSQMIPEGVAIQVEGGSIKVIKSDVAEAGSGKLQGVIRTLVSNMVHGVTSGFSRELDITGIGYKAAVKGNLLSLNLGFSHTIDYALPDGITAKVDKNTHIVLSGADKVVVGMAAAKIRSFKKPEPYQGKGVRYSDERIVRKQGKTAGAAK